MKQRSGTAAFFPFTKARRLKPRSTSAGTTTPIASSSSMTAVRQRSSSGHRPRRLRLKNGRPQQAALGPTGLYSYPRRSNIRAGRDRRPARPLHHHDRPNRRRNSEVADDYRCRRYPDWVRHAHGRISGKPRHDQNDRRRGPRHQRDPDRHHEFWHDPSEGWRNADRQSCRGIDE